MRFKIGHEHWTLCKGPYVCLCTSGITREKLIIYWYDNLLRKKKKTPEKKNNRRLLCPVYFVRKSFGFRVMKLMDAKASEFLLFQQK